MVRERKIIATEVEDATDAPFSGASGPPSKPLPAGPSMTTDRVDDQNPNSESDTVLFRPKRIADMVGQREVMDVLEIAIDAARKRGEQLGHILFDGPPGLGKTTFATCIPREMGVNVEMTTGPSLKAPKELIPYLTNLERGSVLFIDEIHWVCR